MRYALERRSSAMKSNVSVADTPSSYMASSLRLEGFADSVSIPSWETRARKVLKCVGEIAPSALSRQSAFTVKVGSFPVNLLVAWREIKVMKNVAGDRLMQRRVSKRVNQPSLRDACVVTKPLMTVDASPALRVKNVGKVLCSGTQVWTPSCA